MRMQAAFVFLLFLVCHGLCSDVDQEKREIEEELISSLFTSKVKQSKHSAPPWRLSLLNVCRMLSSLSEPWQEAWQSEEQEGYGPQLPQLSHTTLEELYHLQNLCRVLQPRELQDSQEYLELDQNSENPLKRKSPYILKRQLHTSKARRPYILKRSTFY